MNTKRKYAPAIDEKMRADYEAGCSLSDLSKKYKCAKLTAAYCVRRAGGTIRPKSKGQRPRSPIEKIMCDWNDGMPVQEIVDKYKIPSAKILYSRVQQWKRRGYEFSLRKKGKAK